MNDDAIQFNFKVPPPPEPGSRRVSEKQVERILRKQLAESGQNPEQPMWELAQFYKRSGRLQEAGELFRALLVRITDPEVRAQLILALGQAAEQSSDYESAVRFYREALTMEPSDTMHWYFIHNNLGFSLNTLGQFAEGEQCCRRAIAIDPDRPNAHKNLGLALAGQGRFSQAAEAFVQATIADAADDRAFKHLEKLLADHPELHEAFVGRTEACRTAVKVAGEAFAKAMAPWQRPKGDQAV